MSRIGSQELFKKTGEAVSLQDCERIVKEARLNEIRVCFNIFQNRIYNQISSITEVELDEIVTAVKYFCRIDTPKEQQPTYDEFNDSIRQVT